MKFFPRFAAGPLLLALGACPAARDAPEAPAPPTSPAPRTSKAPACLLARAPALDALYKDGLVFETEASAWHDPTRVQALIAHLEGLASLAPTDLTPEARVVLDNDLWGLVQRARRVQLESVAIVRAMALAEATRARLALTAAELEALQAPGVPELVRSRLVGLAEVGTELPVLSHEASFGLRRVFRIFHGPTRRALFSQLVAVDRVGTPHLTGIVGELEVLALRDGTAVGEGVWQLDREALFCEGPTQALVPEDPIAHVPGLGANGYLLKPERPVPLASNPCAECHEDGEPNGLPTAPGGLARRHAEVVAFSVSFRDRGR